MGPHLSYLLLADIILLTAFKWGQTSPRPWTSPPRTFQLVMTPQPQCEVIH